MKDTFEKEGGMSFTPDIDREINQCKVLTLKIYVEIDCYLILRTKIRFLENQRKLTRNTREKIQKKNLKLYENVGQLFDFQKEQKEDC